LVIFVVWVGLVLMMGFVIVDFSIFSWLLMVWLWVMVLFVNVVEVVVEGCGKV